MATWRQSVASAHGPHAAQAGVRVSPSELGTSTHRRQVSLRRVSAHLFHLHLWTSRSTFLAKCSEPKQVLRSNSVESAVFQSGDRAVVLAGQIGGALPPPSTPACPHTRLLPCPVGCERPGSVLNVGCGSLCLSTALTPAPSQAVQSWQTLLSPQAGAAGPLLLSRKPSWVPQPGSH